MYLLVDSFRNRALSRTARLCISSVPCLLCRAMTSTHLLAVCLQTVIISVTTSSARHISNAVSCHNAEVASCVCVRNYIRDGKHVIISNFSAKAISSDLCGYTTMWSKKLHRFYRAAWKQTRSSNENSVCPSVCLSNAWLVTKWEKDRFGFLYHTKDHLA